ncbi:hypothetical protein RI129_005603 [Pyrocoelia pectoralis]|uniref:Uncharacterized protein n=1 Tax=Pyrocoelia pectoralis TaxID=417401 RepID=A0AAN7VIE7_9COLE
MATKPDYQRAYAIDGYVEEASQYSPASQHGTQPSPHSRATTPLECLPYGSEPQQQENYPTNMRADGADYNVFNRMDEIHLEEGGNSQYLQLDTVQGVASNSPNGSGTSSPGSPRRAVLTHLNSVPPNEQGNLEGPQLTQLSHHISYSGNLESSGNITGPLYSGNVGNYPGGAMPLYNAESPEMVSQNPSQMWTNSGSGNNSLPGFNRLPTFPNHRGAPYRVPNRVPYADWQYSPEICMYVKIYITQIFRNYNRINKSQCLKSRQVSLACMNQTTVRYIHCEFCLPQSSKDHIQCDIHNKSRGFTPLICFDHSSNHTNWEIVLNI